MKIRKNPNGLPVDGTSIPKHSSFIVCELNRSPWDDEVLFAEFMEKWDAGMNLNGSSADPIVISDSNNDEDKDEDEDEQEEDSMNVSFDNVENENPKIPSMLVDDEEEKPFEVVLEAKVIPSDIQPPPQVKRISHVSKELAPPPLPPSSHVPAWKKRGRSMKPLSSTKVVISGVSSGRGRILKNTHKNDNNNPDGFYYYSGFGPNWGKKRGGDMSNSSNTNIASSSVATTENNEGTSGGKKDNVPKDIDDVMSEDREAYAKVSNKNNNKKKKNSSNAPSITIEKKKKNKASASDVEYVLEDDDDDAPDEVLQDGKRIRPQKLVKYRSINEIMRLTKRIDL